MNCKAERIPYRQTNVFSNLALDYIDQAVAVKPFFTYQPSLAGIQQAIKARQQFPTDRETLVKVLHEQYGILETTAKVKSNIDALLRENTFAVTTAHQNNIFTGPLYFIYKIIHAIKLADHLKESLPGYDFVPVFYMGTEDADLDELNHIWLGGDKLVWATDQKGAVGRMKIDKALLKLVDRMEGQLAVLPFGKEIIGLLRDSYRAGEDIQTATFRFVNSLFSTYGLIVLLPDNKDLKKQVIALFEDDLLNQAASEIVEETTKKLQGAGYKVQANPREINLFYLKDDTRDRFVLTNTGFTTHDSRINFTKNELLSELREFPERFSPNVILRGLYQESILPGPAFNYTNDPYGSKPGVGGGLHVTLQRVTRGGFLLGIAAGPEILKSRVDIDAVSGSTTVPASGSTTLTSKYFNLRPFAGQRFRLNNNLNMDIAGSVDLAIGLEYGQEKGSAKITSGNTTVYTDRTRNKTRFDFRPGVQARLQYKRYSFLAGMWFGLTNHYKGYLGADLEAYGRLFRAGFGYRFIN